MSVIIGVLKEEFERLMHLSKKYRKEISKLPKGSISIKKQDDRNYVYLAYRENGKVYFKYIGKDSSKQMNELSEKIKLRRKYEGLLKETKKDLKEIERALHGVYGKRI